MDNALTSLRRVTSTAWEVAALSSRAEVAWELLTIPTKAPHVLEAWTTTAPVAANRLVVVPEEDWARTIRMGTLAS